jgi:hypothetical protein
VRKKDVRLGMRIQNSVRGTLQSREFKARTDTHCGKSCGDLFLHDAATIAKQRRLGGT